jgi:hypothetical protein
VTGRRYTRQVRLAEVGPEKQARLAAARVDVRGASLAGEIEARYLASAGVGTLGVLEDLQARAARAASSEVAVVRAEPGAPAPLDPFGDLALDPVAYDVARGAWLALDSLRRAWALGEGAR